MCCSLQQHCIVVELQDNTLLCTPAADTITDANVQGRQAAFKRHDIMVAMLPNQCFSTSAAILKSLLNASLPVACLQRCSSCCSQLAIGGKVLLDVLHKMGHSRHSMNSCCHDFSFCIWQGQLQQLQQCIAPPVETQTC